MALHQYSHCETFFMDGESEAHRQLARRRQAEEVRSRQVQQNIAQDLSEADRDEYGDDILSYLAELEVKALPDVWSIDMQTEIKWHMRPYLLDFLVEVHQSFGLLPETLFLAVNILDRYCSRRVVFKKHYQLVGCTALLIASKYGEASKRVPHIRELQSMCCDQYDEDMFIQMERHVLTNLDWFVGSPTVDEFLQIALDGTVPDSEIRHMALYIAEISLMHREFVSVRPSEIAKTALYLSRVVLEKQDRAAGSAPWTYQIDQNVVLTMSQHLHTPSKVLRNLYRHHALDCVSVMLDNFLHRYAQQAADPGTPPRQTDTMAAELSRDTNFDTPQKNPYGPVMTITPPLTPEGEQFYSGQHKAQTNQLAVPSNHISGPPTPPDAALGSYFSGSRYMKPVQPVISSQYYDSSSSMVM